MISALLPEQSSNAKKNKNTIYAQVELFMHEKIRKLWRMDGKNGDNNKRWKRQKREKHTTYTTLYTERQFIEFQLVGYIIGFTYHLWCLVCFHYVCIGGAAMFILSVCCFVYTSTTQCQNTAAFLRAFNGRRGIISSFQNCTHKQYVAATSFSPVTYRFSVANANTVFHTAELSTIHFVLFSHLLSTSTDYSIIQKFKYKPHFSLLWQNRTG